MGVAIRAADFFAGGADGQQAVQGVFYLQQHPGLDVNPKEDEEGAKKKDQAHEEFADKGQAKEKDPGHHAVTQEEKKHQPAMQAQGAGDLRFAALGDKGGEDVQLPGLDKADEHDDRADQDHDGAQNVLHGGGKTPRDGWNNSKGASTGSARTEKSIISDNYRSC